MKATFKHSVRTFRGVNRKEDLVYCHYNNGNLVITRTLPKREITEKNHTFGAITKHLHDLYKSISAEYKLDLANYAKLYSTLSNVNCKLSPSASALFTGMMWKLKGQFPEIDLVTLTKEDILKHEYPVRSVFESMQNGLLTNIPEASILTHEM
jgi:hypothetical protein